MWPPLRASQPCASIGPNQGCGYFARVLKSRMGYRLTAKGKALRPVLEAMRDWGLKWEPGTKAMMP